MAKELTFRINVAEFERETRRLGPAVVGAYIRILLDYFSQGEAPPDSEAVLMRITGCDPETWAAIRPKLAPLFQIGGPASVGSTAIWYHSHTEEEISAQAKRSQRAKNAQKGGGEPEPQGNGTINLGDPSRQLPPQPPATPKNTIINEPGIGAEDDGDDIDDEFEDGDIEPPVPQPVGIVFEGPIPPDFKPTGAWIAEAQADGYTTHQIAEALDEFKRYNHHAGTTSNNWPELWNRWWNRKKPPLHPAEKKAKPRVEVSRRAPAPPAE